MKILRPFTGTAAVFFPIGKPPKGTCQGATEKCLKSCYAKRLKDKDFDEELLVPEYEKDNIYDFFIKIPLALISEEITKEMDGLQTDIFHWFASGDCLDKDIDKICQIIDELKSLNIIQMGFTRNEVLWGRYKEIFALTIEKKEDAKGREGLFSISNYKKGTSVMYSVEKEIRGGRCGPIICQDLIETELDHFINCKICKRLGTGCFYGK